MRRNTGRLKIGVTWTRIPYDQRFANRFRVGPEAVKDSRDLVNVDQNNYKLFFKYIPRNSCLLRKKTCVKKAGWRRFLSFSTAAVNQGYARFLRVARIGPGGHLESFVGNRTFEYDKCFKQYRLRTFAHYTMEKKYKGLPVATCIQDSQR